MNSLHALMLAQAIDAERRRRTERRPRRFAEPEAIELNLSLRRSWRNFSARLAAARA